MESNSQTQTKFQSRAQAQFQTQQLKEKKAILIFLFGAINFFAVMNGTMFNIALPDISAQFNLTPSEVSWVVTGFSLLFAIGTLIYGKLADIYSIKRLITIGISLFSVGSLIGFLAPSFLWVIIGRILQAIGGSSIPTLVFLFPAKYYPEHKAKILTTMATIIAFASGTGPILGGAIAGTLDWRYLFIFSSLIILTVPFFIKHLPNEPKQQGHIDILGALLTATFIASLLLTITRYQWWLPIITVALALTLTVYLKKAKDPFINPSLGKNTRYVQALLSSFLVFGTVLGLTFVLPIMLRDLQNASTLAIGFVLFPGAVATAVVGRISGGWLEKKSSRAIILVSLSLLTLGLVAFSTFASSGLIIIAFCFLIAYIGFPFIQSSIANLMYTVLPEKQYGSGMGLFNLVNFISGAFGAAILGRVLDLGGSSFSLNPFTIGVETYLYNNLFFILAIVTVGNILLVKRTFEK